MTMANPGFRRTNLAWVVTTSVSASISKTLYTPSFCWRPPCHVKMGCMFIVYSFRFCNDSIAKQYLSVNMVGGLPRDPELTISSLICLNFMRSLFLRHNLITCVSLSSWHFLSSNAFRQTVDPILDKLDRYHFYIMYRLYREATRYVDGKIVKVRFHTLSSFALPFILLRIYRI